MKYPIAYVLSKKFADRKWFISENDFNKLEIHDNKGDITLAQILEADMKLFAEEESTKYQNDRTIIYPPITDQLDMLWHAIDSGENLKNSDFYNTLKAVKDKYPKT